MGRYPSIGPVFYSIRCRILPRFRYRYLVNLDAHTHVQVQGGVNVEQARPAVAVYEVRHRTAGGGRCPSRRVQHKIYPQIQHLGVVLEEVAGPELENQTLHRGIRVRGAICLHRAIAISQQERRDLALCVCGGARCLSPAWRCGSTTCPPVGGSPSVVIPRSLQRLLLHRRVVCVCVFRPPVKGELLLDMRYQSLVFTSMMSPPYPRSQLYSSSGSPGGLAREVSDEAVVSRM